MSYKTITREEFFDAVGEPIPSPPRLFVAKKSPDKKAAAARFAMVDEALESWYYQLNSSFANTRELPQELVDLYEAACDTMLRIRQYERDILIG